MPPPTAPAVARVTVEFRTATEKSGFLKNDCNGKAIALNSCQRVTDRAAATNIPDVRKDGAAADRRRRIVDSYCFNRHTARKRFGGYRAAKLYFRPEITQS